MHSKLLVLLIAFSIYINKTQAKVSTQVDQYLDTVNQLNGLEKYLYFANHLTEINNRYYDTVQYFSIQAQEFAIKHNDSRVEGLSNYFNANYLTLIELYDEALKKALLAEKLLIKAKDSINLARVYIELGQIHTKLLFDDEVIEYYQKSLRVAGKQSFEIYFAAKMNTGGFFTNKEPNTAKIIFLEVSNRLKSNDFYRKGILYNALGSESLFTRDSVKSFLDSALKYNQLSENREALSLTNAKYANYYYVENDLSNAIKMNNKALKIAKEIKSLMYVSHNYKMLAFSYILDKKIDSAELYRDSLKNSLVKNLTAYMKEDLMLLEVYISDAKKDYKIALDYLSVWASYKDSLQKVRNKQKIYAMQVKMNLIEKSWEIDQLNKTNTLQKLKWERGLWIVFFLFSLTVLLFYLFHLKKRKNTQILKQEKKLLNLQANKQELEQKSLKEKIEHQTQQLITKGLQLARKNELLEELHGEIVQVNKQLKVDDQSKLNQIKNIIHLNQKSDNDWKEMREYFDQLNPEFIINLETRTGSLSPAEEKLAALIRLRIDSQACASILNISTGSVKTARYRLKKKLKLNKEDSLNQFIQNL